MYTARLEGHDKIEVSVAQVVSSLAGYIVSQDIGTHYMQYLLALACLIHGHRLYLYIGKSKDSTRGNIM